MLINLTLIYRKSGINMAMAKKKIKSKETEYIPKLYFAVRIRGSPGMKHKILDTLKMLRMHKVNHGVLIWGNKSYNGMLVKCKDYIAFGEINEKTLALLNGEIQYKEKDLYKVKPVFRLHPPKKGHRGSIKKHYAEGGTLGNVGSYINELIYKML